MQFMLSNYHSWWSRMIRMFDSRLIHDFYWYLFRPKTWIGNDWMRNWCLFFWGGCVSPNLRWMDQWGCVCSLLLFFPRSRWWFCACPPIYWLFPIGKSTKNEWNPVYEKRVSWLVSLNTSKVEEAEQHWGVLFLYLFFWGRNLCG